VREKNGYYWDVLAWRNSRQVRAMNFEARAIYREVLDEIWVNGAIPNDPDKIAILIGWPADTVLKAWPQIHDCLKPTKQNPDLFTNARLEQERMKRNKWRRQKIEAGRHGGNRSAALRIVKSLEDEQDGTGSEPQADSSDRLSGAQAKRSETDHSTSNKEQDINTISGVVITLPLNTGPEYQVTEKHISEWSELYPAVDVLQSVREMRGWLNSNPERKKTKRGIMRFCNRWLQKCQDRAPKIRTGVAGYNPTGVVL
jgi:hypothetical protein